MSDIERDETRRGGTRKEVRKITPGRFGKQPLAERLREEPEVPLVPPGKEVERGEQSPETEPSEKEEPGGERRQVVFTGYTPLDPAQLGLGKGLIREPFLKPHGLAPAHIADLRLGVGQAVGNRCCGWMGGHPQHIGRDGATQGGVSWGGPPRRPGRSG